MGLCKKRVSTVGLSRPNKNHKAVGERSQAIILAKLLEEGYTVLTPYGDNQRYDLVIEDSDGQFWRIQCKTGWIEEDGAYIEFNTASSYAHTRAGQKAGYGRRGYQGQIEYFAVYSLDTKGVYLVPIEHAGATNTRLRLTPTKNRQVKGVLWAKDYEL